MPDQGNCRSCGAAILWVKTRNGKSMPLDAEPCPDGTLVPADDGRATSYTGPRYKSHFATCPNAMQLRKRKESTDAQPG
jgi:hypothetical protein